MAMPPLAGEGCELHVKAFCAPFSCMESLLLSLPAAPRARGDAASVLLALFSPKGCGRVVLGSPWVQADRSQLLLCCLPFTDPPGALRVCWAQRWSSSGGVGLLSVLLALAVCLNCRPRHLSSGCLGAGGRSSQPSCCSSCCLVLPVRK